GGLGLAFADRVMGGLQELRADLLVAGGAGFVLQLPIRRDIGRDRRILLLQLRVGRLLRVVNAMAVVACDVVLLVAPRFPECEVAVPAVAFQAGAGAYIGGWGRSFRGVGVR